MAQELLRAEGFTDIQYVAADAAVVVQKLARDEVDCTMDFAPTMIAELDAGAPMTMLAGMHVGCFELFAKEDIRRIADLKGRNVGVRTGSERRGT